MKRTFLVLLALCLLFSAPVFSQDVVDLTGQMTASGYLGYALGFGDAFFDNAAASFGPNFGLGGQFYYGWKENIMVGGELMLQNYKSTISFLGTEGSESSMEINILANILYAMNYTDESAFFLTGGTGLYDFGGMKLGLNGGIVYRKLVSETMYLYGMPRLHIIFADGSPMMLQLAIGVQFSVGG